MSPKTKTLKMSDVRSVDSNKRRKGLQSFSALVPEDEKFSFADHIGETFYIIKLEKKFSDNYGDGYIVHVKELPTAHETFTAGVFGAVPCKQLDVLWQATLNGTRMNPDSSIPITTEEVPTKKGMSYRFIDPFKK